eukprot:1261838-Prymnesium_polylepis.1
MVSSVVVPPLLRAEPLHLHFKPPARHSPPTVPSRRIGASVRSPPVSPAARAGESGTLTWRRLATGDRGRK